MFIDETHVLAPVLLKICINNLSATISVDSMVQFTHDTTFSF